MSFLKNQRVEDEIKNFNARKSLLGLVLTIVLAVIILLLSLSAAFVMIKFKQLRNCNIHKRKKQA